MEKQSPVDILQKCRSGNTFDRLKFSILLNELTQSQFNDFCDQVIRLATAHNPNSNRLDELENKV